jgi:hypothetical protein
LALFYDSQRIIKYYFMKAGDNHNKGRWRMVQHSFGKNWFQLYFHPNGHIHFSQAVSYPAYSIWFPGYQWTFLRARRKKSSRRSPRCLTLFNLLQFSLGFSSISLWVVEKIETSFVQIPFPGHNSSYFSFLFFGVTISSLSSLSVSDAITFVHILGDCSEKEVRMESKSTTNYMTRLETRLVPTTRKVKRPV